MMTFYFVGLALLIFMVVAIPKTAFRYNRIIVSFSIFLYSAIFLYLLTTEPLAKSTYYFYDAFLYALVILFLIYRPFQVSLVTIKEYFLDFEVYHKLIVLFLLLIYVYCRKIDIGLVWDFAVNLWIQTFILTVIFLGVISYAVVKTGFVKKVKFIKTTLKELFVTGINMFFFVALPEEILFRGLLYGFLLQFTGNMILSIAVTTIIFSIAHLRYGLQMVLLGGIAGLFYNILYVLTGNIYCVTAMHVGVNLYRKHFLQ
jgi:membrane protease YdiL (CAAX protease family)